MTLPVTTVSLQNKAQVSLVQKAVNKEDTDHLNVIFWDIIGGHMMSQAIFCCKDQNPKQQVNLPGRHHHHVRKWTNIIARPIFNSITIATRMELGPCERDNKRLGVIQCHKFKEESVERNMAILEK